LAGGPRQANLHRDKQTCAIIPPFTSGGFICQQIAVQPQRKQPSRASAEQRGRKQPRPRSAERQAVRQQLRVNSDRVELRLHMNWCRIILGFAVSIFGGHLVISTIVEKRLWPKTKPDYEPGGIKRWTGMLERTLYTGALMWGAPQWVAVWLATKAIVRWQRPRKPPEPPLAYDIWLIGSGLSILFGFIGAWIALGKLPPSFCAVP
jgi:hypothetical protein